MNKSTLAQYIHIWTDFYKRKSVSKTVYSVYLEYAKDLWEKDLPVIFDLNHLSSLLGLDKDLVGKMINSPHSFYQSFEIKKRNGKVRTISAPYKSLKYVQTWIYENILSKVKINRCIHGFVPNRNIVSNAKIHVNNEKLLKVDLKDFFPSIPKNHVIHVFESLGYHFYVAVYLASLCCLDDCLPQGAPTSPALSNIIANHMDNRFYRLAKSLGLKYTRYADDIAFSGKNLSIGFMDIVRPIIEECGFNVNEDKIHFYNKGGSKILTGVSIANGKVRLPREYRRILEQELYYIRKYGFDAHVLHNKINKPHYLETIMGKLCYWMMVEPQNQFAKDSYQFLHQIYCQKYLK